MHISVGFLCTDWFLKAQFLTDGSLKQLHSSYLCAKILCEDKDSFVLLKKSLLSKEWECNACIQPLSSLIHLLIISKIFSSCRHRKAEHFSLLPLHFQEALYEYYLCNKLVSYKYLSATFLRVCPEFPKTLKWFKVSWFYILKSNQLQVTRYP